MDQLRFLMKASKIDPREGSEILSWAFRNHILRVEIAEISEAKSFEHSVEPIIQPLEGAEYKVAD